MMTKKWIILISLTTFLLLLVGTHKQNNLTPDPSKEAIPLQTEVYEIRNGYGYKLWAKSKLLVQQDFIPAYPGNQPFTSYDDAQKVAELVLQRIRLGKDPRIRKEDLEQLLINIPNLDR